MALKGQYNFKGIQLPEAYLVVYSAKHVTEYDKKQVLITEAVLNQDNTIDTPAVYGVEIRKIQSGLGFVKLYKDAEAKESNPNSYLSEFAISFESKLNQTSKNIVIQAYEALKLKELYSDYIDV
jgi:hypothetical protein